MIGSIFTIFLCSILIMYACKPLEQALDYYGRNMSSGAKGSLLLAVASSLPEIMVSLAFVFSGKPELILAGVFVTAGSAVFNILLIPALSILNARDSNGIKVDSFCINRSVLSRDTFYLLAIEALFIYMLGLNVFTISMAVVLTLSYFIYTAHVLYDSSKSTDESSYEYEELDHDDTHKSISWIGKVLDFNENLFDNKEFTNLSAFVVVILSASVVGLSCHYLAHATEALSLSLGISVMVGAAIFAAAATSLPDTLLSISAAKKGDYEDAVGNAVGSNIFDTSFAVGLPMIISLIGGGMLIGQDLSDGIIIEHLGGFADSVRWIVWGSSALAAGTLLLTARKVTRKTAYFLLSLYALWIVYVVYHVM